MRAALERLAERSSQIADESKGDLPKLPLHDRVHHEAVWSLVDTIAGPTYPILPTEAFVLRAAIFVHDLGLTLAAYPDGEATLRADPRWDDAVAIAFKAIHGHRASAEALMEPTDQVVRAALEDVLLKRHAERAEVLAVEPWQSPDGSGPLYLIESEDIRSAFGQLIGRIAASHWWPVSKLASEFAISLTPPPGLPEAWVVDSLKVACLLRTADAAQLDASRTPALTYAVRRPRGISDEHWRFQKRLHRPVEDKGRLKYTTGSAFPPTEQAAWWLGYSLLQLVHNELQAVDGLLAELGKPQLLVRGVAGIETPEHFSRFIRTDGWLPHDTRLRVSDVKKVITEHTGHRRRNRDRLAALRELIQNAIDAIEARRLHEELSGDWGQVIVRLRQDDAGYWLEVEDSGVGMSPNVLTKYLTDFGASFWNSPELADELPGLPGKGFESIGMFGSGFYDAFALGNRVSVISRRADAAQSEVYALEFDGVDTPPLLRKASMNEGCRKGGTIVRVLLLDPPREEGGLLYSAPNRQQLRLAELCAFTAPHPAVTIDVEEDGKLQRAVSVGDWSALHARTLVSRIADPRWDLRKSDQREEDASHLTEIREPDGRLVGRCALGTRLYDQDAGVVTEGGLRIMGLQQIAGIIHGQSTSPARDMARPLVSKLALSEWATTQGKILAAAKLPAHRQRIAAWSVYRLGGNPGDLPVCHAAEGPLSYDALIAWASERDQFTIVPESVLRHDFAIDHTLELAPNTIACPTNEPLFLQGPEVSAWPLADPPSERELNEADPVYGALLAAWGRTAYIPRASAGIRRSTTPRITVIVDGKPTNTLRYLVYTRRLIDIDAPAVQNEDGTRASRR